MPIFDKITPIDLDGIETYDLSQRKSKVNVSDFARPIEGDERIRTFLDQLPDILAVRSLREVASRIRRAKESGKPIIWGIGGHVIKVGLAPVLIDLIERGFVSAIACNGSVLVHDLEIALAGSTSEDVDTTLGIGGFGAARQTGEILNRAAQRAFESGLGLGSAIGDELSALDPEYAQYSVMFAAHKAKVPITAHITIGADIGHFHPSCDGASIGAASHTDFRIFCSLVREMNGGGVYLNFGSAVTLPEIFLKAVTVVRNLGNEWTEITTANFDFVQHYRPLTNVVKRPTADGAGQGFSITGHHEFMLPLLAAEILCGTSTV